MQTTQIMELEAEVRRLKREEEMRERRTELALLRIALGLMEDAHAAAVRTGVIYEREQHYSHHQFDSAMRSFTIGFREMRARIEQLEKVTQS